MADSKHRRRRNGRNGFMYWWPVTARVAGVLIATVHMAYSMIEGQPADASVLAFCGGLIVAPNVLGGDR